MYWMDRQGMNEEISDKRQNQRGRAVLIIESTLGFTENTLEACRRIHDITRVRKQPHSGYSREASRATRKLL